MRADELIANLNNALDANPDTSGDLARAMVRAFCSRGCTSALLRGIEDYCGLHFETEMARLDYVPTSTEAEMSDEQAEIVDRAETIIDAMETAQWLMMRRVPDDARHHLYTRLPRDVRDLFHPDTGLRAH